MRYKDDHAAWHKHVHNVELDAVQVLKMHEMDENMNTIDFSSRRTGKTFNKEMWFLKFLACNSDQELGIVAPKEGQAITNLNYHLDAIRRSPILNGWLNYKSGRKQLSDTGYQFANRSKASAYGIMSQVDGGDLTCASLEEVDDMPADRLYSRFLLMMGSSRRAGADTDAKNDPRIAITGVFKGADTLTDMLDSGKYHPIGCFKGQRAIDEINQFVLEGQLDPSQADISGYNYPIPIANAINGIGLGMLNANYIQDMRAQLSPDEYARQLLCVNTSARNLIWEKWLRLALQKGLKANTGWHVPEVGKTHKKRGTLSFGYDASGHGESATASRSSLVVAETIGNFTVFIWAKLWPAGTDEAVIKRDLISYWRYFNPDYAQGDAFGVGMLTQLNEELFSEGLTQTDRRTIADGNSTQSSWEYWAFAPVRFEGMAKHQMASALAQIFYSNQAVLPYFSDDELERDELSDMATLLKQLVNIKQVPTSKSYASYKMVRKDIGDDLFDAAMACVWCLVTRGVSPASARINTNTVNTDQLLGQPSVLLPSQRFQTESTI